MLLTLLALCSLGFAQDVAPPVTDSEGFVTSNVTLDASAASVRAFLSEPGRAIPLSPDATLLSTSDRGACDEITVQTPGVTSSFQYTSLRCATSTGFSEHVIRSEHFAANDVEWKVEETSAGTEVTLRVRAVVNWVPNALVESRVARAVAASLTRLRERLAP